MAAVLACGGDLDARGDVRLRAAADELPSVVVSHDSAAALFAIGREPVSHFEISTTLPTERRVPGVKFYRRPALAPNSVGYCQGIPVTSPVQTLIDLATRHGRPVMERAINEGDKLGLVRTDDLRLALDDHSGEPGVARLRSILDRRTFRYTRSELERLVVETDGLSYHRTPAQQAEDRKRDQDHSAAGLTPLRFTHAQIHNEPDHVVHILRATASWLRAEPSSGRDRIRAAATPSYLR